MEQCLKEITPQIGANVYEKNIKRIQELRSQAITDITDIEAYLEEGMESPQSRDIARDNFIKDLKNFKASIHNIERKTSITCNDLHTASTPKLLCRPLSKRPHLSAVACTHGDGEHP